MCAPLLCILCQPASYYYVPAVGDRQARRMQNEPGALQVRHSSRVCEVTKHPRCVQICCIVCAMVLSQMWMRCKYLPRQPGNISCSHLFMARSQVRLLADPHGELARGLGLELEAKAMLGTNRSKRYSAVIQDNEIKALNVEPDGTGAHSLFWECVDGLLRAAALVCSAMVAPAFVPLSSCLMVLSRVEDGGRP
jgi:hypothetical protein